MNKPPQFPGYGSISPGNRVNISTSSSDFEAEYGNDCPAFKTCLRDKRKINTTATDATRPQRESSHDVKRMRARFDEAEAGERTETQRSGRVQKMSQIGGMTRVSASFYCVARSTTRAGKPSEQPMHHPANTSPGRLACQQATLSHSPTKKQ